MRADSRIQFRSVVTDFPLTNRNTNLYNLYKKIKNK